MPAAPEAIPALVGEGAGCYQRREFWHAHESWETAWHALRAHGPAEAAGYLRGMILITAALENARRGKEAGFKRQFAEGLHQLHAHAEGAAHLGLREPRAWERALAALYADACRRREWAWWNTSGWTAPPLTIA